MKRIGIDVGGTNTDAVLIDGENIIASIKVPTTQDVMSGVKAALSHVAGHEGAGGRPIDAVMIGTTHFTNAVVERARLERVAAIRIALPTGASLPPMCDWPEDLRAAVDPLVFMVHGGHEYDGSLLVPMIPDEIREAAMKIRDAGITSIAISATFSPLTTECEVRAAEIVRSVIPDARITLSHTLGRIGLLERENVALLNAALQSLGKTTVQAFSDARLSCRGVRRHVKSATCTASPIRRKSVCDNVIRASGWPERTISAALTAFGRRRWREKVAEIAIEVMPASRMSIAASRISSGIIGTSKLPLVCVAAMHHEDQRINRGARSSGQSHIGGSDAPMATRCGSPRRAPGARADHCIREMRRPIIHRVDGPPTAWCPAAWLNAAFTPDIASCVVGTLIEAMMFSPSIKTASVLVPPTWRYQCASCEYRSENQCHNQRQCTRPNGCDPRRSSEVSGQAEPRPSRAGRSAPIQSQSRARREGTGIPGGSLQRARRHGTRPPIRSGRPAPMRALIRVDAFDAPWGTAGSRRWSRARRRSPCHERRRATRLVVEDRLHRIVVARTRLD